MNMFMELLLTEERVERFLCLIREATDDGCWLFGSGAQNTHRDFLVGHTTTWQLWVSASGRQQRRRKPVRLGAHVFAYWLFVGPLEPGQQVLHVCPAGRKDCVQPGHLYAGSHDDNMADRLRDGGYASVTGDRQHASKVSDPDVVAMRAAYAAGGVTFFELAERYGITWRQAVNIVRGKQRRSLPGAVPWEGEHWRTRS